MAITKIQNRSSFWDGIAHGIKLQMGLIYDPNNYPDAPKPDTPLTPTKAPTKAPTKVTEELPDDVNYNSNVGKFERPIVYDFAVTPADKKANRPTVAPTSSPTSTDKVAWEILKTPTKTLDLTDARQRTLTAADIAELKKRGLDLAKAQVIKNEWYNNEPRNIAAKHLKPKGKGYYQSEIGLYYAVYNLPFKAAIKAAASPTPKEK